MGDSKERATLLKERAHYLEYLDFLNTCPSYAMVKVQIRTLDHVRTFLIDDGYPEKTSVAEQIIKQLLIEQNKKQIKEIDNQLAALQCLQ